MKQVLLAGLALLTFSAFGSPSDKGNGGFLYSRTSKKLLDKAQESLKGELAAYLKNGRHSYSSSSCSKDIDLKEFQGLISDLRYDYTGTTIGTNPDGQDEKRYFQISRDGKVTATEVYFSAFVDMYFRYEEETDLKKKEEMLSHIRQGIVHEALHVFNYNEQEAFSCSKDVLKALEEANIAKVERKATGIRLENEKAVVDFTCSTFKTMKIEKISFAAQYESMQRELVAQRILSHMVEVNKNQVTFRPGMERSTDRLLTEMASYLREDKNNCQNLGKYIHGVLKFQWEKEIPTVKN